MKDSFTVEPNYCDYCSNFDKEHIGMDGTAVCKLTNKIVYSEDGGDCLFFNVPKERIIVPPCKAGDTVYQLDTAGDIYESKITRIIYDTKGIAFDESSIGKTVFLTREEAEKNLKGR